MSNVCSKKKKKAARIVCAWGAAAAIWIEHKKKEEKIYKYDIQKGTDANNIYLQQDQMQ